MSLTTGRSRLLSQIIWPLILLTVSGISSDAQSAPRDLKPVDAVQGIVAAFQQHSVVIIGEAHWLRQAGDFYVGFWSATQHFRRPFKTSSSNSRAAIISHCLIDMSPVKMFLSTMYGISGATPPK